MNPSKKKKTKPVIGDINYDMANGSVAVYDGKQYKNVTSSTIATAYDKMAQFATTGTGSYTSISSPKTMTEEEKAERIEEVSLTLENLIADFIPEADKDVPTKIAKAVVKELFESSLAPLMLDMKAWEKAESVVANNIAAMTMEEYAKARTKILGKKFG